MLYVNLKNLYINKEGKFMKRLSKNGATVSAKEAIATVLNTLDEAGVDPIKELALLTKDTTTPLNEKIGILKELAQYTAPKRKSVDINLESEEGITVKIVKVNSVKAAADSMFDKDAVQKEIEQSISEETKLGDD